MTNRRARPLLVLTLTLLAATAEAQAPNGAQRWIATRHAAVTRLLQAHPTGAALEQRNAQVTRILNDMIDLQELARRSLDPFWAQRTEAERQEFLGLLRQLIERNYRQNLDRTLDFAVSYEPEQVDAAAGTAVVRTVARSRTDARAAPVTIEYRMRRSGNAWVVFDLVTNGSSLVQTYHDSYTRIIRDRGFPELITRLRARVASLQSGGTTAL